MPRFSILIPTYNRRDKLAVVLDAVAKQTGLDQGEVIVGIDGSTDGTEEYLQQRSEDYPCSLTFFKIKNSGRSVIRNQLIDRAQGEILLFIQDDIIVSENWLQSHLKAQEKHPAAVVGFVTWYPEQEITPYMHWLENGGHMLDFASLKDGGETDFWHFYMGNISLPAALINDLRFDETLPCYGWEDILFGLAFVKRGNKVYYEASASAFHWDEYLEKDLPNYMEKVGRSALEAEQKYPGTGFVPPFWKRCVFRAMILLSTPIRSLLPQTWRWYLEMKRSFLVAVAQASPKGQ
jgi:glycosyltransferase involved in cell wall biosynthesis